MLPSLDVTFAPSIVQIRRFAAVLCAPIVDSDQCIKLLVENSEWSGRLTWHPRTGQV